MRFRRPGAYHAHATSHPGPFKEKKGKEQPTFNSGKLPVIPQVQDDVDHFQNYMNELKEKMEDDDWDSQL